MFLTDQIELCENLQQVARESNARQTLQLPLCQRENISIHRQAFLAAPAVLTAECCFVALEGREV